jgi:hypothetical protein
VRVHRLVRAGAIEEVRQENKIPVRSEALAQFEHRWSYPETVHKHKHRRPRPVPGGFENVTRAGSVFGGDSNLHAARFAAAPFTPGGQEARFLPENKFCIE